MKRYALPFLLMAALATACSTRLHRNTDGLAPVAELTAIDSLMWSQPDSAFTQLLAFAESPLADSLDTFNGHYFHLLLSELLYKNYYAQTNRDDLLRAVAYFDSVCGTSVPQPGDPSRQEVISRQVPAALAFLDARAHYIDGAGYYEMDSAVPACRQYLQALEVMESRFSEKDLVGHRAQFMALAYNRLGDLFSEQYMMESSIYCYENALLFCRIRQTSPQGISKILTRIGKQYDMLGDKDNARRYYEEAIETMPDIHNSNYRDLVSIIALSNYQAGIRTEQSLDTLRHIIKETNDTEERLTRFLTIGSVFFEEGLHDSALCYLSPVFENAGDPVVKAQSANYLRTIYANLGDDEKLNQCICYLAQQKGSEGKSKALAVRLEDYFHRHLNLKLQEQMAQEKRFTRRKTGIIVLSIGVVAAVILIMLSFGFKKQMKVERSKNSMEKAAMSGRLKQSYREARKLQEKLSQRDVPTTPEKEHADSFAEEPISRFILDRVNEGQFKSQFNYSEYKDYALNRQHLLALREAADWHYNRFTFRLCQTYSGLKKADIDYCCLYLLGLNDADIAALMQRAYNTVSARGRKIKALIGDKGPNSDTLRDIANRFKNLE